MYFIFIIAKILIKNLLIILNCSSYMRTLKLLNLHCNKIDDNTKVDETLLTVDNSNFQGFGPASMRNGSIGTLMQIFNSMLRL